MGGAPRRILLLGFAPVGFVLLDYSKRFKEARDNLVNFLGLSFLMAFLKTTKQYRDCKMEDKRIELMKTEKKACKSRTKKFGQRCYIVFE